MVADGGLRVVTVDALPVIVTDGLAIIVADALPVIITDGFPVIVTDALTVAEEVKSFAFCPVIVHLVHLYLMETCFLRPSLDHPRFS
jgi:hypothetical protein